MNIFPKYFFLIFENIYFTLEVISMPISSKTWLITDCSSSSSPDSVKMSSKASFTRKETIFFVIKITKNLSNNFKKMKLFLTCFFCHFHFSIGHFKFLHSFSYFLWVYYFIHLTHYFSCLSHSFS